MYSFKSDYSEGAHPLILEALVKSNMKQSEGYGKDTYCIDAIKVMKKKMEYENVDIHFIPGGTQTNLTAISSFLRPYEAVISANTGHIFTNEAGAIEYSGHKIITVDVCDGKLRKEDIVNTISKYDSEHVVKPRLVYITNSTEIGTIYSKKEIKDLRSVCDENNLILYLDGARLGSALCCEENDITLNDLCKLTDAYYIGATKNGALFGEALVICKDELKEGFRINLKQKGAMLAKGRLLGIQFLELFKDNLFFDIGEHENKMAKIIRNGITELGYKESFKSPTNQIFIKIPNSVLQKLEKMYEVTIWEETNDNNTIIRLVTSWATSIESVENFIKYLKEISK